MTSPHSPQLELIQLEVGHIPRMVELEQQLFPGDHPWSAADFHAELGQAHTLYLGVRVREFGHEQDYCLVGYAGLASMGPADDPEFEVHTIGVDPQWQGKGIARMLMDEFCGVADQLHAPIFLEVRTDNTAALALYERYGFVVNGLRKQYYQPSGADAFTMMRAPQAATELSVKDN